MRRPPPRSVLLGTGVALGAIGLIVLAGWIFGLNRLVSVVPGLEPMPLDTALCVGVLGLAFIALAGDRRALTLAWAVLAGLSGVVVLLLHATDRSAVLNTTFFSPAEPGAAGRLGSPDAAVACALVALGLSLLAMGRGITTRLGAALAGAITLLIALIDLTGHGLNPSGQGGALVVPQMALQTAVAMTLAGAALCYAGWWLPRGVGEEAYSRIGLAAGVLVALLGVLLAQLLRTNERRQIGTMVQLAADGLALQLTRNQQSRITALHTLAVTWPVVPSSGWATVAATALDTAGTRRGLGWVAPGAAPRWLALAPGERELDDTAWWPDSTLLRLAESSDQPVAALGGEGHRWIGLLARTSAPGGRRGYLWSVEDAGASLAEGLGEVSGRLTVAVRDGETELLRRGTGSSPALERLWGRSAEARLGPIRWRVTVGPTASALARSRSILPIMTLSAGALVAILLGLALALARAARQRAGEIETAHARLTTEIGEREAAEAALRQREEELRQAQKLEAVGRLAGGIAHDYNNILTVIRGNARSLLLREGLVGLMRDALEHIDRAAARGSLLTARLLAFSQRQLLQPEILSLGDLILSLREELGQLLGPHVRLVLERAPDADLVRVDRRWMSQVVLDIGFNAREAMPLGGLLRVRTRSADDALRAEYGATQVIGPALVLEIEDSGRGMDEATRGRLFEPFFSTKKFGQGSGLALASAYGIIRQSGGEILVKSIPDLGTRVGIFLPVAEGPASPAAPTTMGGAVVLVAEDEPGILRFLRRTLENAGCRVIPGESGEAALAALEQSGLQPDLLVSDIVMPGISGVELADRARARQPGLAVLFISAYTSGALKQQGIASLGAYLLQKPFTSEELLEQVGRTLAQRSAGTPGR
jgi:signal transduction histidine kinase/ActR/RegA family two-component response regulator